MRRTYYLRDRIKVKPIEPVGVPYRRHDYQARVTSRNRVGHPLCKSTVTVETANEKAHAVYAAPPR